MHSLWQAARQSSGPEVRPTPAPIAKSAPASLGTANDKIAKRVEKLMRKEPGLTREAAFDKVFTDPQNAALRDAALSEEWSRWR